MQSVADKGVGLRLAKHLYDRLWAKYRSASGFIKVAPGSEEGQTVRLQHLAAGMKNDRAADEAASITILKPSHGSDMVCHFCIVAR